ncbi:MAG: dihydrofolate reductase [Methyloceanibacter sp.]|uniref:dihydrofolate reductase n=1 Tax=Methyloceanibacter sp. TaxID=1965321 RepID=UPI003D6CF62B
MSGEPRPPIIALVVAMAENRAIGRGGDLPWRLRSDMRYFRKITMGKPVIMGRRTFMSLPRVLDGRLNVVLTRNAAFEAEGALMAYNLEEALDVARKSAKKTGAQEIMIIGGEGVFREVLPQAGRIYLTEVHAAPDADTFFPELDLSEWREVFREAHAAGPNDDHAFSFVVLERMQPSS